MKRLALLLLLSPLALIIYSQGIKPQNIYRVTVTSRYVLQEGERTNQFHAVNQEIYDSLGRLHTEIDFDRETRYPGDYRWHFFDSMLLVRTEYYVDEILERRVVFEYDPTTLLTAERHYTLQGGDTLLFRTLEYTYDDGKLPVRVEARNPDGRRLYRSRSTYDDYGNEIRRRVTGRRGDPEDGIRRLDREAGYDSIGLLVNETVSLRMSNRSRSEYAKTYRYDEEGNMIEMTEYDEEGNQVRRKEYVWQQGRNRLQRIITYDADDNMVKYLAKRYEIYRTPDRRQRVIDY